MLTDERAALILEAVSKMDIDLPTDVEELGPSFLQHKILEVNRHNSVANIYYREVLQARMGMEKAMSLSQSEYEVSYDATIISDKVMLYPSQKDRESKTKNLLKPQIQEIQRLKAEITGVKHIETILKSKLAELKTISQDIQKLRSLMRDSIDTQSYRGTESMNDDVGTIQREPEELLQGVSLASNFDADFEDMFSKQPPEKVRMSPLKTEDITPVPNVDFGGFLDDLS